MSQKIILGMVAANSLSGKESIPSSSPRSSLATATARAAAPPLAAQPGPALATVYRGWLGRRGGQLAQCMPSQGVAARRAAASRRVARLCILFGRAAINRVYCSARQPPPRPAPSTWTCRDALQPLAFQPLGLGLLRARKPRCLALRGMGWDGVGWAQPFGGYLQTQMQRGERALNTPGGVRLDWAGRLSRHSRKIRLLAETREDTQDDS